MAQITVKLSLRVAWWVRWYLAGVGVAARLTGATLDITKVERWIRRGLSVHASSRPQRAARSR
ncbi:hypothetical protein [Achromobacter marplatensis]|uniref:Uncharacterized protein n=1 Tax=Achromobacter marplatensis TaxID=470868 RepID=A0AA43B271_9BURK|nr:hypothetical protein [Achromobacter marplatensis]MDH2052863.1 hypothetical protein [Achromobacter marplatensis]